MIDIADCPVGLPNGTTVIANKAGSIPLSTMITLHHVRFVPHLTCNLISVSQMNDDLNTIVQFTRYMCVIHDPLRAQIRTGIRRDSLYYFTKGDSVHHFSSDSSGSTLDLWHCRMGHPFEKIVKLLPPCSFRKGNLNKACEVCFRAKQSRDKFPISDTRSTRIFEKVHCDMRGPYK